MKNKKVTYSNRQVKGEEDLFAPDDLDSELVGGKNQTDPYSYLNISRKSDGSQTSSAGVELGEGIYGEANLDPADEEPLDKLGAVTAVSFEQVNRFTGDGTFLADVIVTIQDVEGADDYEVEFKKIS